MTSVENVKNLTSIVRYFDVMKFSRRSLKHLFPLFTVLFIVLFQTRSSAQSQEIDSLKALLQSRPAKETQIQIQIRLSELYRKSGSMEDARIQALKAFQSSKEPSNSKGLAAKELGIIHWMQGTNDSALMFFEQAKENFLAMDNPEENARLLNNYGLVYLRLSELPKAVSYFLKAEQQLLRFKDEQTLANTYNNLAATYQKLRYFGQAINVSKKSLILKKKIGDEKGIANTLNNIGTMYYSMDSTALARSYYFQALGIKEKLNDQMGMANTYGNIANLFADQQAYDSALKYQLMSLRIRESIQDFYGSGINKNGIGNLLSEMGRFDEAERYLNEAAEILEQTEDQYEIAQNFYFQADLYERWGKFDLALNSYKKFTHISDSLNSEANLKEVGRLEAESQFKQKEAALKEIQLKKEAKLIQSRYGMAILFLATLLAAGIAYFIYRGRKHARQLNTILQRKNSIITENHLMVKQESNRLSSSNELKNRIFSILSHDLKTPLFQIRQLLDMHEEGEISPEEYLFFKNQLSSRLDDTIDMTNNMLNWASRLIKGDNTMEENVPVEEITQKIVGLFTEPIETKKLSICTHFELSMPWQADRELYTFLLRNLLHNAIKFSQESGEINIRFHHHTEETYLEVEDNGIGMNKEQLQRLFTRQSNTTLGTNKEKGTGIGLIMCKELVELANGNIEVRSIQGAGTTFRINF